MSAFVISLALAMPPEGHGSDDNQLEKRHRLNPSFPVMQSDVWSMIILKYASCDQNPKKVSLLDRAWEFTCLNHAWKDFTDSALQEGGSVWMAFLGLKTPEDKENYLRYVKTNKDKINYLRFMDSILYLNTNDPDDLWEHPDLWDAPTKFIPLQKTRSLSLLNDSFDLSLWDQFMPEDLAIRWGDEMPKLVNMLTNGGISKIISITTNPDFFFSSEAETSILILPYCYIQGHLKELSPFKEIISDQIEDEDEIFMGVFHRHFCYPRDYLNYQFIKSSSLEKISTQTGYLTFLARYIYHPESYWAIGGPAKKKIKQEVVEGAWLLTNLRLSFPTSSSDD